MSLLPSFNRARSKQTLEDQGFFETVEKASSTEQLKKLIQTGQQHYKQLGLDDQLQINSETSVHLKASKSLCR